MKEATFEPIYVTTEARTSYEKKNNHNHAGTATAMARKAYESKVGIEAVKRVGKNQNLKGVVHEILYRDAQNINPTNVLKGAKATLSKSTTAVRDDVLLMKGGQVIGRSQLKDTANSITKTVKQVSNKKYVGTKLVGTSETTKAFNEAVKKGTDVTQKMTSSNISSVDTSRIAAETIGKNAASKVTKESLKKVAGSSGVVGGVISGGIEAVSAGMDLYDGKIDGEEFAGRVVKETVGGGLSAAGGSVAATAVSASVATALAATSAPLWVPAAAGIGVSLAVGTAIKGLWDWIVD